MFNKCIAVALLLGLSIWGINSCVKRDTEERLARLAEKKEEERAEAERRAKLTPEERAEEDRVAAEKKAAIEAEKKRKAEEEYEVDGLVLLVKSVKSIDGHITGTVVNRTGHKVSLVQITYNLYDAAGARVGTARDSITDLEAGGSWKFRARSFGVRYTTSKLDELTGF